MLVPESRKERIHKKERKTRRLAYAACLLTALFAGAIVGAEASGHCLEIPVVEQTANAAETVVEKEVAVTPASDEKSLRVDKTRIWLNAAQAQEGVEAPVFIALCVHEVRNDRPNDALAISTDNFRKIIREFKSQGYWFIDSNDLVAIKNSKMAQPPKTVFLSFDDGYEDNYTNAFPIIREEGVKATFFLITDYIGKENRMNADQIKQMAAAGMSFGSHTVSHGELVKLSAEDLQKEMSESKAVLQRDYGITAESIAYPGGFQSEEVLEQARENYEIAFTANMDVSVPDTAHTIHRFGVFRWSNSIANIIGD